MSSNPPTPPEPTFLARAAERLADLADHLPSPSQFMGGGGSGGSGPMGVISDLASRAREAVESIGDVAGDRGSLGSLVDSVVNGGRQALQSLEESAVGRMIMSPEGQGLTVGSALTGGTIAL